MTGIAAWRRRDLLWENNLKGYIYIASAFETVNRSVCGQKGSWIDNDPHFWTDPPTWGICRNDLRAGAEIGDYVFFVLPRVGRHPQMIFAYLKIAEKISHADAFSRGDLRSKRMGSKKPNGNVIVNSKGQYNRYDLDAHKRIFERVKRHYVIGDSNESRMLTSLEIRRLAPAFVPKLAEILEGEGLRAVDFISRKGRVLKTGQVEKLLAWLRTKAERTVFDD